MRQTRLPDEIVRQPGLPRFFLSVGKGTSEEMPF